jgi:hypothetical protein
MAATKVGLGKIEHEVGITTGMMMESRKFEVYFRQNLISRIFRFLWDLSMTDTDLLATST